MGFFFAERESTPRPWSYNMLQKHELTHDREFI